MKRSHKGMTTTQKIDRVVTNRWLGLPIFVVVMALVYYLAISVGTGVVTDWANDGISGDGFLYTGGAAYEEAVGEWEGEQANIEAYLAAAEEDGIDVEGATAALEAEEPPLRRKRPRRIPGGCREGRRRRHRRGRGDRRIRRGGRRGLCNRPRS